MEFVYGLKYPKIGFRPDPLSITVSWNKKHFNDVLWFYWWRRLKEGSTRKSVWVHISQCAEWPSCRDGKHLARQDNKWWPHLGHYHRRMTSLQCWQCRWHCQLQGWTQLFGDIKFFDGYLVTLPDQSWYLLWYNMVKTVL